MAGYTSLIDHHLQAYDMYRTCKRYPLRLLTQETVERDHTP